MSSAYTESETEKLIELYSKNPCIETVRMLATKFNRTQKSIIAKLSKEGVYVTRGYRDYSGEVPITKLEMCKRIEDVLDVSLPGLDKAPKLTIKRLTKAVTDLGEAFEGALESLADYSDRARVQGEMLRSRRSTSDDEIAILLEGTSSSNEIS